MIDTKLDAKFTELIARLPPQPAVAPAQPPLRKRARRLCFADTQASGVGAPAAADVAAASDVGQYDDYVGDSEDEVEKKPQKTTTWTSTCILPTPSTPATPSGTR